MQREQEQRFGCRRITWNAEQNTSERGRMHPKGDTRIMPA